MTRYCPSTTRRDRRPPAALALSVACLMGVPAVTVLAPAADASAARPPRQASSPAEAGDGDRLQPRRPAGLESGPLGRDAVPLVVESLGLAMLRPADSNVSGHKAGSERIATIGDGASPPAWTMSVQRLMATSGPPTPAGQLEAHFESLRDADQTFTVLTNEPREIAGQPARICYLRVESDEDTQVINGWLIIPIGERLFLIFSSLSTPEDFDAHRALFDAMFRTINLKTAEELSQSRLTRLEAGRAWLDSITPEQLRALVGREHWTRVYRPANASEGEPEREVGYAVMEIRAGRRGELNPERPPDTYSREERMEGIFVRIQGRLVGSAEREVYFDSIALYWLAWDQSAEAWSVRGTQRQGDATRSEAETGLRLSASTGNPRPTLTVIHTTSSLREPYEWSVPNAYLSQALGPILAMLLPMEPQEAPREMAYYHYQNAQGAPQLTLRLDRWEPAGDASEHWKLTTRMGVDSAPVTNIYDRDRRLIRREMPDGVIAESTTLSELRQLWERKGLPLGPSGS